MDEIISPDKSSPAKPHLSFAELLAQARQLETDKDLKQAAVIYLQCLKLRPASESCYHRLMILYRKQQLFAKEAAIITKGIKTFEALQQGKKHRNPKVAELSNTLLKSTGLVDAKGNRTFNVQPIGKWKQRLVLLQKRHLSKR